MNDPSINNSNSKNTKISVAPMPGVRGNVSRTNDISKRQSKVNVTSSANVSSSL